MDNTTFKWRGKTEKILTPYDVLESLYPPGLEEKQPDGSNTVVALTDANNGSKLITTIPPVDLGNINAFLCGLHIDVCVGKASNLKAVVTPEVRGILSALTCDFTNTIVKRACLFARASGRMTVTKDDMCKTLLYDCPSLARVLQIPKPIVPRQPYESRFVPTKSGGRYITKGVIPLFSNERIKAIRCKELDEGERKRQALMAPSDT